MAHESCRLFDDPQSLLYLDLIPSVVGYQADFFGSIERTANLYGNAPGLDQMEAEYGDEAAMGSGHFDFYRSAGQDQGGACRVEHGVIRAIAGAIDIARVEQ